MPVYEEEKDKTVREKKENKQSLSPVQVTLLYTLGFIFFAASTMVEGFFSSQIFTIGHCGPHALPPRKVRIYWKTRPGVDKVKPKVWFKCSLLIDF